MSHKEDDSGLEWLRFDANSILARLITNLPIFLQQEESILQCFQGFQERTKSSMTYETYKSAIERALLYYIEYHQKSPHTTIEEDKKEEQVNFLYKECINFIAGMPSNIANFSDKYKKKMKKVIE